MGRPGCITTVPLRHQQAELLDVGVGPVDDLVMGHLCPHGHGHLIPQCAHDDPQAGDVRLDEAVGAERVGAVRAHLAGHHP